ncbi:MAG: HD domain-containing phosphohydrolase [Thermodesulfobacteriota bacterium]
MDPELIRQQLFSHKLRVVRGVSPKDAEEKFCPLDLRSITPRASLTFPLFLKVINPSDNTLGYLLLCAPGEVFQEDWLTRLREMKIDRLYFHYDAIDQVIVHLNDFLTVLELQDQDTSKEKLEIFYEHMNLTLMRAWNAPRLGPHIHSVIRQVEWIIRELQQKELPFYLLWDILLKNYTVYNHAVNVFLISLGFMLFTRSDHYDCRNMAIGALFHDVGLGRLPQDVLLKPAPLNPEEWTEVRKHPRMGYELLRDCTEFPADSLQLVLEHHENADGSGYPLELPLKRQHPNSRILRLVDAYDALTCNRPYRPAQGVFGALKTIRSQEGPKGPVFDHQVLARFIQFLAV